jgi:hypothetical protein
LKHLTIIDLPSINLQAVVKDSFLYPTSKIESLQFKESSTSYYETLLSFLKSSTHRGNSDENPRNYRTEYSVIHLEQEGNLFVIEIPSHQMTQEW